MLARNVNMEKKPRPLVRPPSGSSYPTQLEQSQQEPREPHLQVAVIWLCRGGGGSPRSLACELVSGAWDSQAVPSLIQNRLLRGFKRRWTKRYSAGVETLLNQLVDEPPWTSAHAGILASTSPEPRASCMLGAPSAISPSLAEPPVHAFSKGDILSRNCQQSYWPPHLCTMGYGDSIDPVQVQQRAILGQRDENGLGFDANTSYAMRGQESRTCWVRRYIANL